MNSIFTRMLLISFLALLLGACGPAGNAEPAELTVGEAVQMQGTVVDTVDDCAFDGICAYVVETDQGAYNVIWSEGMTPVPCQGDIDTGITVGDMVEFSAEVRTADSVSVCPSADYFVREN
ncbi:MAG: hypothetical protein ACLFVO_18710 [Chloroflexaceae bacterium]